MGRCQLGTCGRRCCGSKDKLGILLESNKEMVINGLGV